MGAEPTVDDPAKRGRTLGSEADAEKAAKGKVDDGTSSTISLNFTSAVSIIVESEAELDIAEALEE